MPVHSVKIDDRRSWTQSGECTKQTNLAKTAQKKKTRTEKDTWQWLRRTTNWFHFERETIYTAVQPKVYLRIRRKFISFSDRMIEAMQTHVPPSVKIRSDSIISRASRDLHFPMMEVCCNSGKQPLQFRQWLASKPSASFPSCDFFLHCSHAPSAYRSRIFQLIAQRSRFRVYLSLYLSFSALFCPGFNKYHTLVVDPTLRWTKWWPSEVTLTVKIAVAMWPIQRSGTTVVTALAPSRGARKSDAFPFAE